MVAGFIHFIWKVISNTTVILVCAGLIIIGFQANQPMSVPDAPEGMTYVEFMQDRIDAAKTVEPLRCGWGMMLSLTLLSSIGRVVYTAVAVTKNYWRGCEICQRKKAQGIKNGKLVSRRINLSSCVFITTG